MEQIKLDGLPSSVLTAVDLLDKPLTQLLADAELAPSGKQVKDALGRNAVFINGVAVGMEQLMDAENLFGPQAGLFGRFFITKLGKKKYHLFERK